MLNVEVLNIFLSQRLIGKLFRFENGTTTSVIRFVAEDNFAVDTQQAILSLSMLARNPEQQASLWKDVTSAPFNGSDGRLPAFFQNMLPEGVFRTHLAQVRGCREDDHFALFAACGLDLPGAVKALPADLSREQLAHLVTQEREALEMSVTADPLPLGVSISGVQPKLGLIEQGGRYVARKRQGITRIIGKLPQIDRPMLPEVEHLSLTLAQAAGADVCEHKLVPLEKMDLEHGYTIGGSRHFLAVTRFDRDGAKRIHCEDFAQVMNVDPHQKYTGASYAGMASLMMRFPESLGVGAVHEFLRLLVINDLIGNYDAHLKNFCLIYPDGRTPYLAKAFDIVAWSVYLGGQGSALALYRSDTSDKQITSLSPASIRTFCERVGVAEKPCVLVIRETISKAYALWPDLIAKSLMQASQKEKLLARIKTHRFAGKAGP
jgi:serine/threonine-protein kinase HipA